MPSGSGFFRFRGPLLAAASLSLTLMAGAPASAQDKPFTSGFFIGVEGSLVTPYFESDIAASDRAFGPAGILQVFSFDWDAEGAYRGWIGYERSSGFGVSLGHSILNQSTDFSLTEAPGGELRVDFDPNSDDANIDVDGTLVAKNTLDMDVTDLEFWQRADLGALKLRFGAGLRYAMYDRSYFAFETGGNEFVRFDHEFEGIGPSINYEAEIPVRGRVSLYNSGRAAFLFGEHKSNYRTEQATGDAGAYSNDALVTTLDAEVGLQWRGRPGNAPGELTLRAGVDAQAWFNGGGWDFLHEDSGATFPQNAGTFGLLGFNVSAQYKFGAVPYGEAGRSHTDLPAIVAQGWFIGAEGTLATPYFESDLLGFDRNVGGAPGPLQVLSFDWDADGAYRGWVGYERASGFGVSLSHAALNQSTSFSRAEGAGELEVQFDPDSDDPSIFVDGTLIARNTLDMDVTDLEFWQAADLGALKLRFGAGLRYAMYDRSFFAFETGGTQFIRFDHEFEGIGPSLNYEVEIPVRGRVSLYNSGRAAFLFGEHESAYQGSNLNDDGASSNHALVTTLDAEVGLQWRGRLGDAPGELTLRAGVDAQAWLNGGGWDLLHDDGGALFPQQAGGFGLLGFNASAQYKFGAGPDGKAGRSRATMPAIVAQGWFIGAEGALATPYFERDVLGADRNSGAANTTQIFSFDWDADGAYRGWVGYERASGFGFSLSHAALDQSTSFSRTEGPGENFQVTFDPNSDGADFVVDGTLIAKTTLDMDVTDLEFWQRVDLNRMNVRFGAGLRYAMYDRSFFAFETGGPEFVRFNHSFDGIGPSLNYEAEVPVRGRVSLYNSGRAAFLFGEHKSDYTGVDPANDTGASSNHALVTTLDGQLGLQWQGQLGDSGRELTLRAGVDGQAWLDGGGWDMFSGDGGADFPQQAGSFGIVGFVASATLKFGAGPR